MGYVHRIGRTGRAGKTGRAVTLFTSEDQGAAKLVELLRGAGQEVPSALAELVDKEARDKWTKDCQKNWFRRGHKGKCNGKGMARARTGRQVLDMANAPAVARAVV